MEETEELQVHGRPRLILELVVLRNSVIVPLEDNRDDHVYEYDRKHHLSEVVNGNVKVRLLTRVKEWADSPPSLNQICEQILERLIVHVELVYLGDYDSG